MWRLYVDVNKVSALLKSTWDLLTVGVDVSVHVPAITLSPCV